MNWSNAAPTILEKVMFFTAHKEQRDNQGRGTFLQGRISLNERNKWLLTMEKLSRVSVHWKKVVFSSKILFPSNKSIDFDNGSEKLGKEAKILLKAGFLSLVKGVSIDNPKAFQYTGNVLETTLHSIDIGTNMGNIKWTEEDIRSMMDIISKSPNASQFILSYHLQNQNDAILFWQLLLKIVHCNSKPKTIHLDIETDDRVNNQIDWHFVKKLETSGIGSIESLVFENSPIHQVYVNVVSHLAKYVEINQLAAEGSDFARQIQAKCFKLVLYEATDINWTELKDFEKVIVEGVIPVLTEIVEKVDHPNVHFVLGEKFITHRTNETRRNMMDMSPRYHMASAMSRVPVILIHALPKSKVKTITYPGKETGNVTGGEFLPVPETTFVCNALLSENLDKFIDEAKVRRQAEF